MDVIERLKKLAPELSDGRQTHVEWRNCSQKYRDKNPDIGDKEFHHNMVLVYDERIGAITEAMNEIERLRRLIY